MAEDKEITPGTMTLREWLAKLPSEALELQVDIVAILAGRVKSCGDHLHLHSARVISPCDTDAVAQLIGLANDGIDEVEPTTYARPN